MNFAERLRAIADQIDQDIESPFESALREIKEAARATATERLAKAREAHWFAVRQRGGCLPETVGLWRAIDAVLGFEESNHD